MHPGTRRSPPRSAAERSGGESGPTSPALGPVASPVAQPAVHTPPPPPSSAWARGYLAASRPGRAAITPPLASIAAPSGPPYSTAGLAGPSLSVRRSPIRSTVSLSNRFESPGRGVEPRKPPRGSGGTKRERPIGDEFQPLPARLL